MYWCISEKCVVNTDAFYEGIVDPYENSAYFKSIFFLFYILFYTYLKTILSLFLLVHLSYFNTILSLF